MKWKNEIVRLNGFIYLLVFVVLEMEPRAMCMANNVKESTPGPPLRIREANLWEAINELITGETLELGPMQ